MVQSGGKLVSNRLYQVTGDKKGLTVRVQLHTREGVALEHSERDRLNESEREREGEWGREREWEEGSPPSLRCTGSDGPREAERTVQGLSGDSRGRLS